MHKFISLLLAILISGSFSASVQAEAVINAMLQEWRIVLDRQEIPAGPTKILLQNRGQETHEVVLLKTDLTYDKIPLDPVNGGIDEENSGELITEIENFKSKTKAQMVVDLKPGNYVLLCNMVEIEEGEKEQHYAMGMRAAIHVK